MQKVEGNVTFHTRTLNRVPAAGAGLCALARADEGSRMPSCRSLLGVAQRQLQAGRAALAIIDTPLQG